MGYTVIQDTDIGLDAALTSSIITAIRDNGEAIVEGLGAAPSIQLAALASSTVDGAPEALGNNSMENLPDFETYRILAPFNEYLTHSAIIDNGTYNTAGKGKTDADITSAAFTMSRGGEYTFVILQKNSFIAEKIGTKILINDSVVHTTAETSGADGETIAVHNQTFDAGDVLKIQTFTSTSNTGHSRSTVLIYSSNPFREDVGVGQYSLYCFPTQYDLMAAHFLPYPTFPLNFNHTSVVI